MKKFTVLVALALLAATGTSYAVTCSTDNVPGATLLVPYFNVSGDASSGSIAGGGVDTLVAITNVSLFGRHRPRHHLEQAVGPPCSTSTFR